MDRYMDAWNTVSRAYNSRLQRERSRIWALAATSSIRAVPKRPPWPPSVTPNWHQLPDRRWCSGWGLDQGWAEAYTPTFEIIPHRQAVDDSKHLVIALLRWAVSSYSVDCREYIYCWIKFCYEKVTMWSVNHLNWLVTKNVCCAIMFVLQYLHLYLFTHEDYAPIKNKLCPSDHQAYTGLWMPFDPGQPEHTLIHLT